MTDKEAGERFVKELCEGFTHAYRAHQSGRSVEALLIYHDIIAAGSDVPESIKKAHRSTIKSACEACDNKIPLEIGRTALEGFMRNQVEKVMHDISSTRDH